MLRRSGRKRAVPASRGDSVAPAARRRVVPPADIVSRPSHSVDVQPMVMSSGPVTATAFSMNSSATTCTSTSSSVSPQQTHTQGTCNVIQTVPTPITSVKDELGQNVSNNLKQKIVSGEFVDLAQIFVNSQVSSADENQSLILIKGKITIQPKQTKKILNIESWTDAFIIYNSIYCSAHPEKYLEMLRYMHTIRIGSKRSEGWLVYNEQFRLRKAQDPSSSWAVIDQELWLLYLTSSNTASQFSSISSHKCYPYNYQGICRKQPCSYGHSCLRCHGQHPIINCPRQDLNPNSQSLPQSRFPQMQGQLGLDQDTKQIIHLVLVLCRIKMLSVQDFTITKLDAFVQCRFFFMY